MDKEVTKTKEFESVEEFKQHLRQKLDKMNIDINEYRAIIEQSLGSFPKNQMELLEFIEKVLKLHKVIK